MTKQEHYRARRQNAHQEGRRAAQIGWGLTCNPYRRADLRLAWTRGWREADAEMDDAAAETDWSKV